jgi:hypothetical protein
MQMAINLRMLVWTGLFVLAFGTNANAIDARDVDRFSQFGLGQPEKIQRLAKAFCEIDFSDFPVDLREKLDEALSEVLHSTMPLPSIAFETGLWGIGFFSPETWTVELSARLLSRKKLPRLLQILTHELRHAEQRYISARYHAAIGTPQEDKASYEDLKFDIIEHASNNPSERGSIEFDFGHFLAQEASNKGLIEKKKYFLDTMKEEKNNRKAYNLLFDRYMSELPRERDAKSVDLALRFAIDACLPEIEN